MFERLRKRQLFSGQPLDRISAHADAALERIGQRPCPPALGQRRQRLADRDNGRIAVIATGEGDDVLAVPA